MIEESLPVTDSFRSEMECLGSEAGRATRHAWRAQSWDFPSALAKGCGSSEGGERERNFHSVYPRDRKITPGAGAPGTAAIRSNGNVKNYKEGLPKSSCAPVGRA